jgi:hypothetical protein
MELDTIIEKRNYFDFSSYDKELLFKSIILFAILSFCLTWFFRFENNTLFAIVLLMFCGFITYNFIAFTKNDLKDNNKIIMYKLNVVQDSVYSFIDYRLNLINNDNTRKNIQQLNLEQLYLDNYLDSLYLDSGLIDFFYTINYLKASNLETYYNLVTCTNTILHIKNEISNPELIDFPQNTQELIEVALEKYKSGLNNLQSFIFTIPSGKYSYTNLNEITKHYIVLMTKHINILRDLNTQFINKYGINTNTKMDVFTKLRYDPFVMDDHFEFYA